MIFSLYGIVVHQALNLTSLAPKERFTLSSDTLEIAIWFDCEVEKILTDYLGEHHINLCFNHVGKKPIITPCEPFLIKAKI